MYYRLKDVPKQKVFRNEEKTRNKVLVVKNFMLQEQIPLVTSSAMVPIYKRTEFMGLLLLLSTIT